MKSFEAPLEEILFSLEQVANSGDLATHDPELCSKVLEHFTVFAENVIAPTNRLGDEEGCRLINGRVNLPSSFIEVYRGLVNGGWLGLTAPEEFGGAGLDKMTAAGFSEIFTGANHALQMTFGLLPGAVSTLLNYGSDEQRARWIGELARGKTLNTMCLTEPDAGSDLGRIKTKAVKANNTWTIAGEKIFISGGDQNLSEQILHFVLARTGHSASKTQGLSLFICPAILENKNNNIQVLRVEKKLGIHGSPTCHLRFDNSKAELIGDEGDGLSAMFTLMNHARIDVALQGVAHAARAFDIAKFYADNRSQGNINGLPAMLSQHDNVQQMLDEQRSLTIGSRAMCHLALKAVEVPERGDLADFLTPICKIFASEAGIRSADLAIQILGGYGYLEEYGVSQIWRDARVTSIYEGTNGIHSITNATRSLSFRNGAGASSFEQFIEELAESDSAVLSLLIDWRDAKNYVQSHPSPRTLAREFSTLTSELFYRACWSRIAKVAKNTKFEEEFSRLSSKVLTGVFTGTRLSSQN